MLDTGSCRPVDSDCSMLEEDHQGLIIQKPTVEEKPSSSGKTDVNKKQGEVLLLMPLLMKYS